MSEPRLATLLSLQPEEETWQGSDFAAMLNHQLDASVGGGSHSPTFRDILLATTPERADLLAAKQRAKFLLVQGRTPRQIAEVLYYLAIARGIVQFDERLTGMSDAHICRGLSMLLDLAWLPPVCREHLNDALGRADCS